MVPNVKSGGLINLPVVPGKVRVGQMAVSEHLNGSPLFRGLRRRLKNVARTALAGLKAERRAVIREDLMEADKLSGVSPVLGCGALGGAWNGAGVACASVDCSIGACCYVNGTCTETTREACTADGESTFEGVGSFCAVVTCPRCCTTYPDCDRDGDADMDDFGCFQRCFSGSRPYEPGCAIYDRPEPGFPNGDGDVDSDDLDSFTRCLSGPMVPIDQTCDDPPL